MILNSTKYKNPERTIVGLLNAVSNADTIILCDTSLGAVAIELLEIPNDQWNTTYKLYIADKSNNASVNNITINAPVGFTINNQSSLVISTNGGAVVIRVASNTGYLGSLTGGTGNAIEVLNQGVSITPAVASMNFVGIQASAIGNAVTITNAFISLDNSTMIGLINSGDLIPNQSYNITDAIFGRSIYKHNVYVTATSTNQLSTSGLGQFYNADYSGGGDYSGVTGFVAQTGVWVSTSVYVVGDVAIWNNLHFKNITGSNGSVPPNADATNWLELSYSQTNGYIVEIDYVNYEVTTNYIAFRKDVLQNQVEYFDNGSVCSLNEFRWGEQFVNQNKVFGNSIFSCANMFVNKNLANNFVFNAQVFLQKDGLDAGLIDTFNDNIFWNSVRVMTISLLDLTAIFFENEFREVNGIANIKVGDNVNFNRNSFTGGSVGVCEFTNGASVRENCFVNSTLLLGKKGGIFERNFANNSTINLGTCSGLTSANVLNNANLLAITNEGTITFNDINDSVINVHFNDTNGLITRNILQAKSTIVISNQNSGSIGNGGVKGDGNLLSNTSIEIETLGLTKQIFGNEFYQSQITMVDMQGSMFGCSVKYSEITFDQCIGFVFNNLTLLNAVFGNAGYVVPQSFVGGEYIFGNGSISVTLDCSDPSIYDAGLQRLTIPTQLFSFAGIYLLKNAGGITISNVVGVNATFDTTFYNTAGITTFATTSVGLALVGDIISNQVAPYLFNLTYRLSGTDYIKLKLSGNLNEVTEVGIFV
jgi:hypothetical protein